MPRCSNGSLTPGISSCCGSRVWSPRAADMISLRSHAISLAAVFLALALGIALGSGLLSNTVLSGLRDDKAQMQTEIDTLTTDRNALNEKLSAAGDFDAQMAARILR